jgi:4-amino-4-deoxy-L-arabinose transferase-like glycosyltransferase
MSTPPTAPSPRRVADTGANGAGPTAAPGPDRRGSRMRTWLRAWWSRGDAGPALALGVGALAVYVRSLLPGVGYSGDTAKWQFLGEVGGTPHPTGYPLYLLVNRVFVNLVPVGELAWRANLLSAVLGAGTVAALFALLRALAVRRSVAAATAATFGLTVTFWSQAVVAEVYTLHLLLLTLVALCLARWLDGGSDRWLLAGLGLYCLSFGNHLGSVLALPGVGFMVSRGWRRALRPRTLAATGLFALAGAAQYAYLVRMTHTGAYVEQPVHGVGDVVEMVTGGRFRSQMFAFTPGELVRDRLPMFGRLLRGELGVLVLPALYGVWAGLRSPGRPTRQAVSAHLLVLGLLAGGYALNFDVLDVFVFFLPCYLVLAVFLGIGAEALADRLRLPSRRPVRLAAGAALAAVPLVMGLVTYPRASQRGTLADAHRIERAIAAAGTDAVLITDNYADSEYVWYHLLGEGLGTERDLRLGNQLRPGEVVGFFDGRGGRLAHIARPGTPIYTATAHQADDLDAAGLTVTEVADQVWRITAP